MSDAAGEASATAAGTSSHAGSSSNAAAPATNGKAHNDTTLSTSDTQDADADDDDDDDDEAGWKPIDSMSEAQVRTELGRVREERDTFESQYRSLLSKLTTMRATLGDRLRQDAEELDRRETQIETLTSQVETLSSTTTTLQAELVTSHQEVERLSNELDSLRTTLTAQQQKKASDEEGDSSRVERERELHELVERVKLDASGWETACLEERAKREDLETRLGDAQHELELARANEANAKTIAERESASAANLSAVLSEFQASYDQELSRALGDHRSQLDTLTSSLQEYKSRAETAEATLAEKESLASQAESLTKQVKEKNLLIGKLRHEAVILNEHLTEALRRLRTDQSENNVDKRLVTNLVIQFITTPRADGKRYEMLNLIAGVLDWKDEERAAAGLQRSGAVAAQGRPGMARTTSRQASGSALTSPGGSVTGDESFSNLFVEFLLSEAERGKKSGEENRQAKDGVETAPSTPTMRFFSPTRSTFELSPTEPADVKTNGDDPAAGGKNSGGLGSYFGLSRGHNRK